MTSDSSTPPVALPLDEQTRERKRRQREIAAVIAMIILVLALTLFQLNFLGADSWIYFALFNINLVLMFAVALLVIRNVIKLLIERRRNVFGAKLRTRLVVMFIALTLAPTVAMFLAANRIVNTSVDYWFKNQVEGSMEAALDVGQSFYTSAADRLRIRAESIAKELKKNPFTNTNELSHLFKQNQQGYGLTAIGLIGAQQEELFWEEPASFASIWQQARTRIMWEHINTQQFGSLLWASEKADYVIGVLALQHGQKGYLVVAESIGQGLMLKLANISRGFEEYMAMKNLKRPLKVSFSLILGVLSLLVLFGATWLGFRLSRELMAPVLALAEGTDRIAQGDLSFRLQDAGKDEIGQLVNSFNRMAADLEQSRDDVNTAYAILSQQNEDIVARNAYTEAVLDTITSGVISLDESGRISTANKAAGAILGVEPAQLMGRRPELFLQGEYLTIIEDMFTSLHQRPESHWQRQIDLTLQDKVWKLLVNAVALRGADGIIRGVVAVFEDITELERMQRMAAWREVARRIAHEIKNPLTPIKLSAQRIEKKFGASIEDPVFTQCTGLIVKQVELLQQMVQEFSNFAKLPEVVLRPTNITPLLDETAALFIHGHSNITWNMHIDTPLPTILMDEKALSRALMNILTNAVEASEHSKNPTISLTAQHDTEAGVLHIHIADNGAGLSAEERSRMFDPYFTRKKGGTGLGLAIVRSIINDHHGYVRARTNPAGGIIVTIELPVP